MLEVVFNESACGSLKLAQRWGGGPYRPHSAVAFLSVPSQPPLSEAEEAARRAAFYERERKRWEACSPLGGETGDVFGLEFRLSIGDISEDPPGLLRRQTLQELCCLAEARPSVGQRFGEMQKDLARLLARSAAGEEMRIWLGPGPDDACGLCWLAAQLVRAGGGHGPVSTLRPPAFEAGKRGTFSWYTSLGELPPEAWHRYLPLQTPASPEFLAACAWRWAWLRKENAPLRALVNGQLISAPEDFYDSFLLQLIAQEPEEFLEAPLIGRFIGSLQLGIGDGWPARRIEALVQAGRLQVARPAAPRDPSYARTLKKRPGDW